MKKIGIIAAMEEEMVEVKEIMNNIEEKEIDGLRFIVGTIEGRECVLVKSGVGKVHAARTTQVMIYKFDLECIINVGSAGALNDKLNIGDIIIGKHIVQHDFDITAFDHKKGYIPEIGDTIPCTLDIYNNINMKFNNEYICKEGIIVTGDIFCTDVEYKNKIKEEFNADIIDMESGAIAQVAYLNNIKFGAIRAISDSPNGNNARTFDENLEIASKRATKILERYLKLKYNS